MRTLDIAKGKQGRSITLGPPAALLESEVCNTQEWFSNFFRNHSEITVTKDGSRIVLGGPITEYPRTTYGELFISRLGQCDVKDGIGRSLDPMWIDEEMFKSWKEICEREHGAEYSTANAHNLPRPQLTWLIDVDQQCLVPAGAEVSYVALSYVWGQVKVVKASTQNLQRLREPGAFLQPDLKLPKTIVHALSVVRILGERYLWVDALCIVQDDETLAHLINNMAAVYANACLTIVAADGADAEAGLSGLKGISAPRSNPCILTWPDGTQLNWPSEGGISNTTWNTRGWTFQEYLFSRRRLVFVAESVRWECRKTCFWEEHREAGDPPTSESHAAYDNDVTAVRMASLARIPLFPDLEALKALAFAYSERDFSCSEDAINAFAGITTALTRSFPGGFLWGIPLMFLDVCLIWRSATWYDGGDERPPFYRRWDPHESSEPVKHAPTWSWVAWKGTMEDGSLWRNEDFILWNPETWFYSVDYFKRVVPLVQWSIRRSKESVSMKLQHNEWFSYKARYTGPNGSEERLPMGWKRFPIDLEDPKCWSSQFDAYTLDPNFTSNKTATLSKERDPFPPRFYYTHDSIEEIKFSYPVPLGISGEDVHATSIQENIADGRYLCCSTHRAFFEIEYSSSSSKDYILIDPELRACGDDHHGFLWVHDPSLLEELDRQVLFGDEKGESVRVELIAVSMMYRQKGGKRWAQPLGAGVPQWYNVLWVEWIDGVAYRKGVGEVSREVWESREREAIELVLG